MAPYFDLVREMKNPFNHRLQLVESACQRGLKPTARLFATTVPTVRKWLRRHATPVIFVFCPRSRATRPRERSPARPATLSGEAAHRSCRAAHKARGDLGSLLLIRCRYRLRRTTAATR